VNVDVTYLSECAAEGEGEGLVAHRGRLERLKGARRVGALCGYRAASGQVRVRAANAVFAHQHEHRANVVEPLHIVQIRQFREDRMQNARERLAPMEQGRGNNVARNGSKSRVRDTHSDIDGAENVIRVGAGVHTLVSVNLGSTIRPFFRSR